MTNMKQDQNKPREKCRHEKFIGGVCVKCDYVAFTDMNKTKEIEELIKAYTANLVTSVLVNPVLSTAPQSEWEEQLNKRDVGIKFHRDWVIEELLKIESHIKQELIAEAKKRVNKLKVSEKFGKKGSDFMIISTGGIARNKTITEVNEVLDSL